MGAAALGYLPPVAGALFQEAIDLALMRNALRLYEDRSCRRSDQYRSASASISANRV